MPTSFSATVRAKLELRGAKDLDFGPLVHTLLSGLDINIGYGTGPNQCDQVFADQRTLGASASEDLDLRGSLVDPWGNSFSPAKLKVALIRALPSNLHDLIVGGAAVNAFVGWFGDASDTEKAPPSGIILRTNLVTGWPVTAGTGDLLKLLNGGAGGSNLFDIALLGTSV